MSTIRDKFHDLGNCHSKISLASLTIKESLMGNDVATLSKKDLKDLINDSITILNKIETYVIDAAETVEHIVLFIYKKVGSDTPIPNLKSI